VWEKDRQRPRFGSRGQQGHAQLSRWRKQGALARAGGAWRAGGQRMSPPPGGGELAILKGPFGRFFFFFSCTQSFSATTRDGRSVEHGLRINGPPTPLEPYAAAIRPGPARRVAQDRKPRTLSGQPSFAQMKALHGPADGRKRPDPGLDPIKNLRAQAGSERRESP